MGFLILTAFVAALALYMVVSEIRIMRRPTAVAIDYVRRSLSSPHPESQISEVVLNHALPLSDHMVKDLADARGYRYAGVASSHGNTALRFQRPDGKRMGLSIDG